MGDKLVSILIPCFNAEHTIGETLESVLSQSWQHIEIIVVDDGSADGSAAVVERFASRGVRLQRQSNKGQTAALNACLRSAQGDFVQYLDADDLLSPEKIELQMRRLVEAQGFVASAEWGRFRNHWSEASFIPEEVWRDLSPLDWLAGSRAQGLGMMFPALWLIPRAVIEHVGPWREDLSLNNDAEYFTRMVLASSGVLFCPGARCYYRSGQGGNLSGRKTRAAWLSQFKVLDECERRVLAREDSERMRRGFALSWQHFAHAVYPYDRALAEQVLARGAKLHEVQIGPDGGPTFRLVSHVLGWRLARRLQLASGRP